MLDTVKNNLQAKIGLVIFVFFTLFWLYLHMVIPNDHIYHKLFGAVYGIMALVGGIWGLNVSKKWGGLKSVMGKAIFMFSVGLLAQEFGQLAYSYNDYVLHQEGLYPSWGDLGYFGSIPLYIYGISLLGQASGVKIKLKSLKHKLQAVFIPLVILSVGYFMFLQGYKFNWSKPLTIFLDFGYPFGQAIYISLAILTYSLSTGILGGIMKNKIRFILFALLIQFLSDYTFLYQNAKGTWHVGEINDYMYFLAYFIMTLGLLQFNTVLSKLRK